jgi:hypothetical protein
MRVSFLAIEMPKTKIKRKTIQCQMLSDPMSHLPQVRAPFNVQWRTDLPTPALRLAAGQGHTGSRQRPASAGVRHSKVRFTSESGHSPIDGDFENGYAVNRPENYSLTLDWRNQFGAATVEGLKVALKNRDDKIALLEMKLARLEATLEQRNFAYLGVFKEGKIYGPGMFASHGGALWHCNQINTTTRPGDGAAGWTLAVKNGRDGKDGKDAQHA